MITAQCLAPGDAGADVGTHGEVIASEACPSLKSEHVISGPPQTRWFQFLPSLALALSIPLDTQAHSLSYDVSPPGTPQRGMLVPVGAGDLLRPCLSKPPLPASPQL